MNTLNRSESSKLEEFENIKRRIHQRLVDKIDLSRVGDLKGESFRREIRLVVEHLCDSENSYLNRSERDRVVEEVLDETLGLGPLEFLLKDPSISDILINGPKNIYVERRGKLEKTETEFRDNPHLMQIIDRIVSRVGRRVDETCPMVDARLEDGSRVNAIIPPLSLDGAAVSIRRFGSTPLKLEGLLNFKAFTPEMVMLLEGCIKARLNVIISGGTGSGKTTLLNCNCSKNTSFAWRPAQRTSKALVRLPRRTSSATLFVCVPNASSSANAEGPRRWTCCRR